jgi:hypothetical protein
MCDGCKARSDGCKMINVLLGGESDDRLCVMSRRCQVNR